MGTIQELCGKAVLMQNGTIVNTGNTEAVVNSYLSVDKISSSYIKQIKGTEPESYIAEVFLTNSSNTQTSEFLYNEVININFRIKINHNKGYSLFCVFSNQKHNRVFAAESMEIKEIMRLKIKPNFLVRGDYYLTAFINIPRHKQVDIAENICNFSIIDTGSEMAKHGMYDYGSVFGQYGWD
jgi:lipopolysaccharide transport system ATP-binding protein